MAGIISFGAYVPLYRLNREEISRAWGGRAILPGERAVANFDEDCVTMAVAAAMECTRGMDRKGIDSLYSASTTSPYKEKLCASIAANALSLKRDILAGDSANSLRSGTIALRQAIDSVKAGYNLDRHVAD